MKQFPSHKPDIKHNIVLGHCKTGHTLRAKSHSLRDLV